VAAQLAASQEGLSSMTECVIWLYITILSNIVTIPVQSTNSLIVFSSVIPICFAVSDVRSCYILLRVC
jgi:hypothetical protein